MLLNICFAGYVQTFFFHSILGLQSPCLEIKLHVTITYGLVFIRMYVPSFMAVMMAWSSFWIHRDEVSARIKLGTLVVWTMVTEFVTIGYTYPEYLRAPSGNVWMTGCLSFTWLSFFLYIVVHVVRRREKAKVKQDMELEVKKKKEEKRTGERAFSISGIHPVSAALHFPVVLISGGCTGIV